MTKGESRVNVNPGKYEFALPLYAAKAGGSASPKTMRASPKTQDLSGGRTALFANALRTTRSTSSINYQLFPNPLNL